MLISPQIILYRRHEARRSRSSPGGGSVAVFVATVPLSSVYFRAPLVQLRDLIFWTRRRISSIVIRAILISLWSCGCQLRAWACRVLGASLSFCRLSEEGRMHSNRG